MTGKRIRVLLDCRMASWTGVGRYTLGLARALSALDDDLDFVCVVARRAAPPCPGAVTVQANLSPLSPLGMAEFGSIQNAVAPDVTHCLHFPTPFPAHRPLVVTLHDLSPLVVDGLMPSVLRRFVYRRLNARAALMATVIVCPSWHTASDVERLLPRAKGKTRVIPEAADDFASGPVAVLDGRLAVLSREPYVLSMGSTRPHKDLPTLLRAFARIADAHQVHRLLLVGADEPGFVDATLGAPSAAVRERVAFTGRVSDAELRALYSGAAAFAFPSRYEGFGLPPLEAMALGSPVVAARAASLPEVVGDAALAFEPGDDAALASALGRILSDPAEAERLRSAGRARAAEFTWEHAARETAALYREVAGG